MKMEEADIEPIKKIENSTLLYPYNGRSLNLIDKFYIFGYNYLTLKKLLIDENPNISENNLNNNEHRGYFKIEEEPSILSELTHDFNKQLVDPETIQNLIFPNGLPIYYRIDDNSRNSISEFDKTNNNKIDFSDNNIGCPKSTRAVFSCHPLEGKNSRKCQNGFAYTFYRKFWEKKEIKGIKYIFYVPYTFCVISEFPFYKSFEKLFRCIRKMFSQQNIYIPLELLLYKIILLTPSPINTDVILDLDLLCNQAKLFPQKTNKELPIRRSMSGIVSYNFRKKGINFNSPNKYIKDDFIVLEESDFLPLDPTKQKINQININPLETKIKFKYLSGYPLVQFNLAKVLFHTLSIEDIIKVFIFSFLESNIIFFSEDNEFLTLTINAYANFNYPLNDAEYYYNIGAISLKDFHNDHPFGIKNSSSIIAINNKFVENYLAETNKIDEHLIVDLDNGELMVSGAENDHSYFKIIELIKKIITEPKNNFEETNFYHAIINLNTRLKEAFNKKAIYENKDFIDFNDEPYIGSIDELNKNIQEAFYECVIILSLYFYENVLIQEDKQKKKDDDNFMKIEYNKNYIRDDKYKKEELLLIKELLDSMKFRSSFSQFVMEHNPIDLYKIPLTFSDEFLSIFSKLKFEKNTLNIKYFELIDKLYLTKKLEEIETIDFSSDMNKYIKNFKDIFDREIQERNKKKANNDISKVVKINVNQQKSDLNYQTYELDERILHRYLHIIMNLTQGKYLEFISDNFKKEENLIMEISMTEVESRIEDFCITNKYLTQDDLCSSNIIILFALCLKYFPDNFECDTYLSNLLQDFRIFRKYISLFLQIIYKIYKQSLEENNYKITDRMILCFYKCFNYVRNRNLVPNENLMFIINKILRLLYDEEKKNKKENDINEEKDINNEEVNLNINKRNLYIIYNFCSAQTLGEKTIVDRVNKEQKGMFNLNVNQKVETVFPKIRFSLSINEKFESLFICQKDLYKSLSMEYNKYIELLDFKEIDKKLILDSCLNILVFIRNSLYFQDFDEVTKILENIFYIFIKNE